MFRLRTVREQQTDEALLDGSERRTASNYSLETGENTTYTHFRCHYGVATDTDMINFANTGNLPEVYCDFRNSIKTGR